jgi:DNA-binding NarL/FixJ family response regulator
MAAGAVPDGEGTITVFLADDVPELRELIRYGLEEDEDFEVIGEAADGRGAIEGVDQHAPHAVVLDLSMPDVDGFQAVLEIRSRRPEVAILVLSGFAADRMRKRVMEQGADGYVEKGAPMAQLRDLIRRAVAERRSASERSAVQDAPI